jgi:hypothetical protein
VVYVSWQEALGQSFLGTMIRGIVKIALAAVIAALLGNINLDLSAVTIGNTTVDLSVIWDVTKALAPLMLVISGLRDLGVRF